MVPVYLPSPASSTYFHGDETVAARNPEFVVLLPSQRFYTSVLLCGTKVCREAQFDKSDIPGQCGLAGSEMQVNFPVNPFWCSCSTILEPAPPMPITCRGKSPSKKANVDWGIKAKIPDRDMFFRVSRLVMFIL
jgi:hypothetical protein